MQGGAGAEKRRPTEQQTTVMIGVATTQAPLFGWRELVAQVTRDTDRHMAVCIIVSMRLRVVFPRSRSLPGVGDTL